MQHIRHYLWNHCFNQFPCSVITVFQWKLLKGWPHINHRKVLIICPNIKKFAWMWETCKVLITVSKWVYYHKNCWCHGTCPAASECEILVIQVFYKITQWLNFLRNNLVCPHWRLCVHGNVGLHIQIRKWCDNSAKHSKYYLSNKCVCYRFSAVTVFLRNLPKWWPHNITTKHVLTSYKQD